MASETDIGNLALAHLGDDADVSSFDPPEGSPQAEHCARFYPIARDTALEAHAWSFAQTTARLDAPGDAIVDGWAYAYALPSNCLRPLRVYPTGGRHDLNTPPPFEVETLADGTAMLLTDVENPWLVYICRVSDTAKFTPAFVEALAWALASALAGPVLKGDTGTKVALECWKVFQAMIGRAALFDARRRKQTLEHTPVWLQARG